MTISPVRSVDDVPGLPARLDALEAFMQRFHIAAGAEVWIDSVEPTVGIENGDFWLGGPSAPANTAPAAFTPTVGSVTSGGCTITASTTDADGNTLSYKYAVTTSATPPADWTNAAAFTSPQAVTGLLASTTYYVHVRAYDGTAATVGTSASFATGVDAAGIFTNDFAAGQSLDTAYLAFALAGGGSQAVVSNQWSLTSTLDADAAIGYFLAPINKTRTETRTVTGYMATAGTANSLLVAVNDRTSAPVCGLNTAWNGTPNTTNARVICAGWSGAGLFNIFYIDNAGAVVYWHPTTNTWSTAGDDLTFAVTSGARLTAVLTTTATDWQLTIKNAAGATLESCTAVAWAVTGKNSDSLYHSFGDPYTNYYNGKLSLDLVSLAVG